MDAEMNAGIRNGADQVAAIALLDGVTIGDQLVDGVDHAASPVIQWGMVIALAGE